MGLYVITIVIGKYDMSWNKFEKEIFAKIIIDSNK